MQSPEGLEDSPFNNILPITVNNKFKFQGQDNNLE